MIYSSATLREYRGKWRAQLKYKEGGKWKNVSKMMKAKGKREAQREMEAWKEELERQATIKAGAPNPEETVADYLARYIEGKSAAVEPSTLAGYRQLFKKQIAPYIGSVALDELSPDGVQEWVNTLNRDYSAYTVHKAFVLLKSAMTQAVERDRLLKNPTRTVHAPKQPRTKPNALDERGRGRVLAVLEAAGECSPAMLGVKIALFTGMREGEICGLRWKRVNLERNTLQVAEAIGHEDGRYYIKDPKTNESRRIICYPEELAADLSARRAAMEKDSLAAGVAFSEEMFALGEIDGSFMHPQFLWRKWKELAKALELVGTQGKRPTFHDLRHTFATAAIAEGIDVKTVSNSMGHANAAMTLNTYASVDPDAKRRAADTMGAAMTAAKEKAKRGAKVIEFDKTGTDE